MRLKNKMAALYAVLILVLIGYIIYMGVRTTEVVIQAGHEGRTKGNTGAQTKRYREVDWNILVADEAARHLQNWDIEVKRVPAEVPKMRAEIAVSIHFDSAVPPCASGAAIGYENNASESFAQQWKKTYAAYFPFKWHSDNFTESLSEYYAFNYIDAEKFLVLELGELSCKKQTRWLKPRLKKIAHLLAYSIATELGEEVEKPDI
jgi:N-acetylmuramoyl-L-alanine amidase